jgi:hypothetical protein
MLGTTRFGQRNHLLLAFAGLLLALVGCQIVAGIKSRTLDPINPGCVLPQGSGPQVRVANLAPTSDLADVCIRNAGTRDWGQPILLNGGLDCASSQYLNAVGFAYGQVSIAFSAPSAAVDVKMIPGGSTCDASALGEGDGLTLATNAVTTLLLIGGNDVPETVIALPESDTQGLTLQRYRLVHAAPGLGPLDFGTMASPHLPTTLANKILSAPISFGGVFPPGTTTAFPSAQLQDNGYLALLTGSLPLGAALDPGTGPGLFVYQTPGMGNTSSLYAIGIEGDDTHPLRALACDEDSTPLNPSTNPLLIPCVPTALSSISVDVYNPALYGPASPYFNERDAPQQYAAIAGRTSDVMCLVEVDEVADQTAIIAAGKASGQYPYSYTVTTNLSTAFTNPQDQNGKTPPAPTTPPCDGVSTDLVNAAISCAEQNCSTQPPGDGTGVINGSTDCLESECAGPFLNIQGGASNGVYCFDCVVVNIASGSTFGATQTSCTTDSRPPLGFGGNENSLILSHYPLAMQDALILPSTFYRRSILYAQVQLEDQNVDFYCGFLMTTENYSALPYFESDGTPIGNYGNGATDSETAWTNEQTYEAQQFIAWQQTKSGSNPAIAVGDWHSSLAVTGGTALPGTSLPTAIATPTMNLFNAQSTWTFAQALSPWAPQCNVCPPPENIYNGATDSFFYSQPFIINWPQASTATQTESLFFNNGVLALGGDAGLGPLSPYFGVNFTVIRPKSR